tara:strand:+ start:439 stop:978 length:540 start_codon:yes stop_codon:yes gene_type:complete
MKDRKLVAFHKDTFEMYMGKWEKKKELEKVITEKAKDLLGDYKFKPSDLFPNPSVSIFKLIEKAYKDRNPMGLSGVKLAELKEINVNTLINNEVHEYAKYVNATKPHIDDYSIYAENDSEIERLDNCDKFIKAFNTFFGAGEVVTVHQMAQITQATNSRIVRGLNNKLMANPKYVKDAV